MNESDKLGGDGINRRKILECMTWAGTGVLWTIAGGVPRTLGLVGEASAAVATAGGECCADRPRPG